MIDSHFSILLRFAFLKAFVQHKDMPDVEVKTFYVETTSCTQSSRVDRICHSRLHVLMYAKEGHTNQQRELGLTAAKRPS